MIWHKTDELPEYGEDVLVHFETGAYIVAEVVHDDDCGFLMWWTLDRNYEMDSTDRWAYIEPPED